MSARFEGLSSDFRGLSLNTVPTVDSRSTSLSLTARFVRRRRSNEDLELRKIQVGSGVIFLEKTI